MTAALSVEIHEKGDPEKLAKIKSDASRLGLKFLPVDINKSKIEYDIVDGPNIRESILVKGLGPKLAKTIVERQPYEGSDLFCAFVTKLEDVDILQAKVVEYMWRAGLWRSYGTLEDVVSSFKKLKRDLKLRRSRQHNDIMSRPPVRKK